MAIPNFPKEPKEIWFHWQGTLEPGDETDIFVEEIYIDLFEKIFLRARRYGMDVDSSEDIASEVIERLYDKYLEFCEKRTSVIKSIASLSWAWIHIYFNTIIQREKSRLSLLFRNENFLQEIIQDLGECIRKLDEDSQRVIEKYYFQKWTLKEIAEQEGLSLNKIYRLKQEAERKLFHCMKESGYT